MPVTLKSFNKPQNITECLYQKYYSEVLRSLSATQLPPDIQEDLMQDLYIRLLRVSEWESIENKGGYIQTIMNNLVTDYLRRQKFSANSSGALPEESTDCSLEQHFLQVESIERIEKVISEQPEMARDLVWRARVSGESHQKIASEKGRSVSWVEKSLAKIIRQSKRVLARDVS